ncbi:MAG: hypothetical protein ACYDHY_11545 [Acidiferrobacterales bacterium]
MMPIRPATFLSMLMLFASGNGWAFAQTDATPIPPRPIQLVQGTQLGKTAFAAGDTRQGGNGQVVDGIEGSGHEMLKTHLHVHVSLFYHGKQLAIPDGIGIVKPFTVIHGFVAAGSGYYWLHTHDATGIVHIESPNRRVYTLGNFFDIWGKPLNEHNVAGLTGQVRAYVNGRPVFGKIRDIVLKAHDQITLEVGKPFVKPPVYIFPQGL